MKGNRVRRIALYLAIFQMLSSHALASGNENINNEDNKTRITTTTRLPGSGEVLYSIQDGKLTYKRNNGNSIDPISIFDKENIETNQYGASQVDFNARFNHIIKEQNIWREVQKYFPTSSFDSYNDAMDFYRTYFDQIGAVGCGYAAVTNFIFNLYEGRENEFQETFGFPMYLMLKDTADYNYELIMLKFFNFYNIDKAEDQEMAKENLKKTFYENKLESLKKEQKEYHAYARKEIKKWSIEEYNEWKIHDDEIEEAIEKYTEKYKKVKYNEPSYHLPLDRTLGYFSEFLAQYGIKIKTSVKDYAKKFNVGDIVASGNTTLYRLDQDGTIIGEEEIDSHYFYITDITKDGKIIISSWGNMYIFDSKSADWATKVVIQLVKK